MLEENPSRESLQNETKLIESNGEKSETTSQEVRHPKRDLFYPVAKSVLSFNCDAVVSVVAVFCFFLTADMEVASKKIAT